jgi:hypothetical protein
MKSAPVRRLSAQHILLVHTSAEGLRELGLIVLVAGDPGLALDLHLYFYSFRDVVSWAIANGFKWYRSSALNYDPKFHLKHSLDPLDLYVRHTSKFINPILRRLLLLLEPTRNDKTLPKFSNYADLWARQHSFPGCIAACGDSVKLTRR